MTHILLLIASLNALHVHGSKQKCEEVADSMVDLAVSDAVNPFEPSGHIDGDLKAIRKFKERCEKEK